MAKKNITIDIIDKEYDDTYIPSTAIYDENNVGNGAFNSSLYNANIGQAGCGFSNPAKYNISGANGTPISSNLKPWSYESSLPPGAGFCGLFYRDTALPFTAGGKLNFPGTLPPANLGVEYVKDFDFTGNHSAGNNGGYMNSSPNPNSLYYPGATNYAMLYYGASPPVSNNRAWYACSTVCYDAGFGAYNPTSNGAPVFTNTSASYDYFRLPDGISDSCGAGGNFSRAGMWQNIQGLTAGVVYELKIKLAGADTSGGSYISMGINPVTTAGINYVPLGGSSSPMYGGAPGTLYGGQNTGTFINAGNLRNDINTEQVFEFTSIGGNEVFNIDYVSDNDYATNSITVDYVSIQVKPSSQIGNWSGVYTKVDIGDANTGSPAGIAKVRCSIDTIDTSVNGDAIIIGQSSMQGSNLTGAVGLNNLFQPQIIASNNPLLGPTHPLTTGMNTWNQFTQLGASTGAFAANDRLFEVQVINASGNTIKFNSLDVRYTSYTSPVNTQTINYDKSVVGTLDVSESEDFPLDLSYTISDGKNLETRFGDYSKSFDLPATKNNNKILNNIWKANVDQKDKKTYGIKECRINVDGIPFFDGSIQVKKSVHAGNAKSYNCTVYGGNFSWMSLLKDKGLCETFDEADSFAYDYPTIESTWNQNQSTTDVQYPLISWRDFNTGQNGIQNYINTFDPNAEPDFQAAFYVYNIIQKIFKNIGYKVDSTYLDSDNFKRLVTTFPFLKNSAKDDRVYFSSIQQRPSGEYQYTNNHVGLNTPATAGVDNGWFTCVLSQDVDDPSQSYDNGSGVWTCQKEGTYDVYAEMGFEIYNTSDDTCGGYAGGNCVWEYSATVPDDSWTWASRVKVVSSGATIHQPSTNGWGQSTGDPLMAYFPNYIECWDASKQYLTVPSFSVTLQIGDTIELQGRHIGQHAGIGGCEPLVTTAFGFDGTSAAVGNRQPRMTITFNDATPNIGGSIIKNNVLPCGTSQVDFIKSISHLFNLYFTTDVSSKTVYIEPFNDFYKPKSEGIDWTTKVDFSQDIVDDYDIGLKSEIRIGYKKDGGDKYMENLNYKSNIYGDTNRLFDYNETLGDDFETGTLEIINPLFASSSQVWDNDAHDDSTGAKAPVLIPNAWTEDCYNGIGLGNNQYRPSELIEGYVPRIFYYCWENPVSFTTISNGLVANAGGTQTYWSRQFSNGSPFQNQTTYPRATFVDWEERVHNQTMRPSLSFNDESFFAPGQFSENTVPGLYSVYYKNMIEQLKEAPRIRTVYINLKMKDILSLDMRKLVYLDETWWRINKVDGYNPAKNQTTKVQLIQWIDVGFYPIYSNGIKIEY